MKKVFLITDAYTRNCNGPGTEFHLICDCTYTGEDDDGMFDARELFRIPIGKSDMPVAHLVGKKLVVDIKE